MTFTRTLAFVADVHLGNHQRLGGPLDEFGLNQRFRWSMHALQGALQAARAMSAANLVVAGDLFDNASPPPSMLASVYRTVRNQGSRWASLATMRGNHDAEHLATAASDPVTKTDAWIDAADVQHLRAIHYLPQPARDYVLAAVARREMPGVIRPVVAFHAGVRDSLTAPWLRNAKDSVDVEELFDAMEGGERWVAIAGNWHDRRQWSRVGRDGIERHVIQCGALAPTGFDNPGILGYGMVTGVELTLRGEGCTAARILESPAGLGPRFLNWRVSSEAGLASLANLLRDDLRTLHREHFATGTRAQFYSVCVRVLIPPEELGRAEMYRARVRAEVKRIDQELPDRSCDLQAVLVEADASLRRAAQTAAVQRVLHSQQLDLDRRVREYVAALPLPPDHLDEVADRAARLFA